MWKIEASRCNLKSTFWDLKHKAGYTLVNWVNTMTDGALCQKVNTRQDTGHVNLEGSKFRDWQFEKTCSERDIVVETYNFALNCSMNFIISHDNTKIDTYEWIAVDS